MDIFGLFCQTRGKRSRVGLGFGAVCSHEQLTSTICCSLVSVATCISSTNGHSWEHSSTRTKIACLVKPSVSTTVFEKISENSALPVPICQCIQFLVDLCSMILDYIVKTLSSICVSIHVHVSS